MTTNPDKRPPGIKGASNVVSDLVTLLQTLSEQAQSLQDAADSMPSSSSSSSGGRPPGMSRNKQFSIPGGGRGVYGLSIRTGLGDPEPVVSEFGNVKMTNEGVVVSETREPLVDVFDEGDEILIVFELPGVAERDIHVELNGDVMAVEAKGNRHRYECETLLPASVDPGSAQQSYDNGYLQIRYAKAAPAGSPDPDAADKAAEGEDQGES